MKALLISICIGLSLTCIYFFRLNRINEQKYKSLNENYQEEKFFSKDFRYSDSLRIENNLLSMNSSIKLININGDTLRLGQLINKKTLIFRFSEITCNSCVDALLEKIKGSNIQTDKLCIITHYSNIRQMIVLCRKSGIKYPIYNLVDNDLKLSIDKFDIPYFFMVDAKLITEFTFIPSKVFPYLTDVYIRKCALFLNK